MHDGHVDEVSGLSMYKLLKLLSLKVQYLVRLFQSACDFNQDVLHFPDFSSRYKANLLLIQASDTATGTGAGTGLPPPMTDSVKICSGASMTPWTRATPRRARQPCLCGSLDEEVRVHSGEAVPATRHPSGQGRHHGAVCSGRAPSLETLRHRNGSATRLEKVIKAQHATLRASLQEKDLALLKTIGQLSGMHGQLSLETVLRLKVQEVQRLQKTQQLRLHAMRVEQAKPVLKEQEGCGDQDSESR